MTIRIAINGYGRIGRNILRALYESGRSKEIQVVALNDLGSPETNAHLTRYDTVHGKFKGTVTVEGDAMVVNGDRIKVLAQRDPSQLPWKDLGVDVVVESTGGRKVNVGFSPGDSYVYEPYVYVGPWGPERPGGADFWNAPFGAAAPRARAGDVEACRAFIAQGLGALGEG